MSSTESIDNKLLLEGNALFSGVSERDLSLILSLAEERVFSAQEFIIHESEPGEDEFYLIKSGEVEILKTASDTDKDKFYRITTLSAGETIGEIALLENIARTASARALTETTVLILPIKKLRELSSHQENYSKILNELKALQTSLTEAPTYAKIALNLAKGLSERLNNTNFVTAEALKHELELSQLQVTTGRFLILIISAMVTYAYLLTATSSLRKILPSTSFITIPNMIFFTVLIIYFMRTTGYPASFFGLTLNNWRKSAIEAILWSIPVMAVIVLIKWFLIHFCNYNLPLIQGPGVAFHGLNPLMITILVVAYLVLTPIQELLVRGAIQGSLQRFLSGEHHVAAAIFVSNLIFGMCHLHMSLTVGLVVFVFGIFWGWMYARQGNLIGVSISHLLIGGWGFFFVGVENILIR